MPKVNLSTVVAEPRRQSRRARKPVLAALQQSLAEDTEEQQRLPPGFNPSDDSDADKEYEPTPTKRKTGNKRRRRRYEFDDDSDDDIEEESPKKVKKAKKQNFKKISKVQELQSEPVKIQKLKSETKETDVATVKIEQRESIDCPFCGEVIPNMKAKYHLSQEFYKRPDNPFLQHHEPDDLKDGKAGDEFALKYQCKYSGCVKRQMGYKQLCAHYGTQHELVRQFMSVDPTPAVQAALAHLFPPAQQSIPSPVKVKQEKVVPNVLTVKQEKIVPTENTGHEMENSEDVDDPDYPSQKTCAPNPAVVKIAKPFMKKERVKCEMIKVNRIHTCHVCHGKSGGKESRQLSYGDLSSLKYHYANCVYTTGGLLEVAPHHQGEDRKEVGDGKGGDGVVEAFGNKFKYKCPFIGSGCDKNTGKVKGMGYKEYAVHLAVRHHLLERWMLGTSEPALREVGERLRELREEAGEEMKELPEKQLVEEVHCCLICGGEKDGKADKEARELSLQADKLYELRYHYASCLYETEAGLDHFTREYSPGQGNTNQAGRPLEDRGRSVKYECKERGCTATNKRKFGYKEFVIHCATVHGGLERILQSHESAEIKEFARNRFNKS